MTIHYSAKIKQNILDTSGYSKTGNLFFGPLTMTTFLYLAGKGSSLATSKYFPDEKLLSRDSTSMAN